MEDVDEGGDEYLKSIRDRLRKTTGNPITRARLMVEREVPVSKRGPGWERHWRELEAYLDTPGHWAEQSEEQP
ncbi:MAG TPA: hypothetical protein VF503_00625 [Sphingobium sp.]|uniref:hypothetical protein n=1 Tax=Sphingobium sp. TaxID=1912891 RepID=UPI002ED27B6C